MADARFVAYDNSILPSAGVGANGVNGTSQAERLVGSAGNDTFVSNGGRDTLIGGNGNDTYVISNSQAVIVEQGNGVDTVKTIANYALPDNVENLFIIGYSGKSGTTGIGNGAANAIVGDGNKQTLDGRAGNDVLTGGGGQDTFIFQRGSGHDAITDFHAGSDGDVISLQDYGFRSLSEVKSAMSQAGSDVVLRLSGTDDVTLRNVKIDDFTSDNVNLALDLTGMKLTFSDEFNGSSLDTYDRAAKTGKWQTEFGYGGWGSKASHYIGGYTGERNIFVDSQYAGREKTALGIDPFSLQDGVLNLHAAETPIAAKSSLWGIEYTSGLLTTNKTFSQTYGYFEIRAKMPSTEGAWPAFWLLPAGGGAPPEIDVFEARGGDPGVMHESVHDKSLGASQSAGGSSYTADATTTFHTYGVLWDKDHLTYYTDGREVWQTATPPDLNQPMYMIVSMAVGSWAGNPQAGFAADFGIDYVRAYSLADATVPTAGGANASAPASPATPSIPASPSSSSATPPVQPAPVTTVTASAAAIALNLATYAANAALTKITISDGGPLVLSLHQMSQYAGLLGKVTGPLAISLADNLHNVMSSLREIGADPRIVKIAVTDPTDVIALTAAQVALNAAALGKLTGYGLAVTDTTANVLVALDAIEANGRIAKIKLTDTVTVPIGSPAALAAMVQAHPKAMAAIEGSLTFSVSSSNATSSTVQTYDETATLLSTQTTMWSKGAMQSQVVKSQDGSTETTLYANGVASSRTSVAADGSREIEYLNIKGKSYVSQHDVYSAAGVLVSSLRSHADGTPDYRFMLSDGTRSTEMFDAAGRHTMTTIASPDGSSESKLFTAGVLTLDTKIHADKSKDVYILNVQNRSYVSEHDTYDAAGTLIRAERLHADGTPDYVFSLADGTKSTQTFDAAGALKSSIINRGDGSADTLSYKDGVLASAVYLHADKSRDIYNSNVVGKGYTAEHQSFDAAGTLVGVERIRADGSKEYGFTIDDGVKTTRSYDAEGRIKVEVQTNPDGSSDTKSYRAGELASEVVLHADKSRDIYLSNIKDASYVSEHDVYSSAGVLTSVERTHADGTLDFRYHVEDGTKLTESFTAKGLLKSSNAVHSDGSSEARSYADGVLRSEALTLADKSKDVISYDLKGQNVVQLTHYGTDGKLAFVDATNADGSHRETVFAANVTVTSHEGVSDLFQSVSTGSDTYVFAGAFGRDTIKGFHAGSGANHDFIQIDREVATDMSQLAITASGRDTVISVGHGNTITLAGIDPATLTHHDFLFA